VTISRRIVPLLLVAAGIVGVAVGARVFAFFAGG
jgi:hypothetical protein